MSTKKLKCVIILSNKSSGSSAIQTLLANFSQVRYIEKTRHFQNETLYWTKSASMLGLPQKNMLDSEVPISKKKAKSDLIKLLSDNICSFTPPKDDLELIFGGWKLLCQKYAPIFLEKSPHHLYQWSALELIAECIEKFPEITFYIIGLVRNPMDTLYSAWSRWRTVPEKCQYEWLIAYKNLLKFHELIGNKLMIIRYEDIVTDSSYLKPVFEFLKIPENCIDNHYLHGKSISKWKADKLYGFKLSEEVVQLAEEYGYSRDEMAHESYTLWPLYRSTLRGMHKMMDPGKRMSRAIRQNLPMRRR